MESIKMVSFIREIVYKEFHYLAEDLMADLYGNIDYSSKLNQFKNDIYDTESKVDKLCEKLNNLYKKYSELESRIMDKVNSSILDKLL